MGASYTTLYCIPIVLLTNIYGSISSSTYIPRKINDKNHKITKLKCLGNNLVLHLESHLGFEQLTGHV